MVTRRYLVILATLSLLVLLIACLTVACDDDDEGVTVTVTATATATATATSNTTTTASSDAEPVKIGLISDWSGPAAIAGILVDQALAVVEKQVAEQGGILGGRSVEFVKYDNKSEVVLASAGAKKLVLDDEVSILALGGTTAAQIIAVAEIAKEYNTLYISSLDTPGVDRIENEFYVTSTPLGSARHKAAAEMILGLHPETVGFLMMDDSGQREYADALRKAMEAASVDVVYSDFVIAGTADMSPYLTRVKYENPDVLFLSLNDSQTLMVAKQLVELGIEGDIQVASESPALAAKHLEGAEGWIAMTLWDPSSDYPVSIKFVEDYQSIHGSLPNPNIVYFYNPLWLAVRAIELAGTDDPEVIAKTARSGNLEIDTPMGIAHIGTNGDSGLDFMMLQIRQGGELVPYP